MPTLPHDWMKYFKGADLDTVFNQATAMFIDCESDEEVARELSDEYGADITRYVVRQIRTDAAILADESDKPEVKLRWGFRHAHLTMNNIVKEYMLISGKRQLLQAKLTFAAELAELSSTNDPKRLWVAVNTAIGRNNIPLDLIKRFIDYHDTYLRLIPALSDAASERGLSQHDMLSLVAETIATKADDGDERARKRAFAIACKDMGLSDGVIQQADVPFFVDYYKCGQEPEAADRDTVVRLMQSTDTLVRKKSPLDAALRGNTGNLTVAETSKLIQELRMCVLPSRKQLNQMHSAASRRAGRNAPGEKIFAILVTLVADLRSLTDVREFYTKTDLLKKRFGGVTDEDFQSILEHLNELSDYEAVNTSLSELLSEVSKFKPLRPFAEKYCEVRFAREFSG